MVERVGWEKVPLLNFTRNPDRDCLALPAACVSHEMFTEGQPEGKTFNCSPRWLVFNQQTSVTSVSTRGGGAAASPAIELLLQSAYSKQVFCDVRPPFYLPLFYFPPLTLSWRARYFMTVVKVLKTPSEKASHGVWWEAVISLQPSDALLSA